MADRSGEGRYLSIAILIIGLLMAATSGTCTVLTGVPSLFRRMPGEAGWAGLTFYFGSLFFGTGLMIAALAWRGLSNRRPVSNGPGHLPSPVGRLFAVGFGAIVLVMIALAIEALRTQGGAGLSAYVVLVLATGIPAFAFGYAAYRAWRTPR